MRVAAGFPRNVDRALAYCSPMAGDALPSHEALVEGLDVLDLPYDAPQAPEIVPWRW